MANDATLNNETAGDSSTSDTTTPIPHIVENGDTVSTVEQPAQSIDTLSDSAEQNTDDTEQTKDAGEDTTTGGKEKDVPFHEHPRFKELIDERNDFKQQLFALQKSIQESGTKAESDSPKPEFEDISGMDDDAILDKLNEDPKGFLANFAKQVAHNVKSEVTQEFQTKTFEEKISSTFNQYAQENPDFNDMWESGKIEKFMEQNPGHNAISAHQLLTAEKRNETIQQQIDEAVKKAIKETEEKVTKNFQAKRQAATLTDSPNRVGRVIDSESPELKDPKRFGGITSVLAQRLAARRASGQI